jgi:hypothetical protein
MAAKSSGTRDAPPTSAPSTSSWASSSTALPGLTEPPYWMRTPAAASVPAVAPTRARMAAQTAWASSAVAVRPVPMAQMGS